MIRCPAAGGIYWLRLFDCGPRKVAVFTEVPGNPGMSVTNAMTELIDQLARDFGVRRRGLAVFEVWPRGAPIPGVPTIRRVRLGDELRWNGSTWSDVRTLVGRSVPRLPRHAEIYRRVLALGGGVRVEIYRPAFEVVPVDHLPPPHNPARCAHFSRFRSLETRAHLDPHDRKATGRRFLATMTPNDLRRCRFHAADWRAIADESVRIVERVGPADQHLYVAAAEKAQLPTADLQWLISLFREPVYISGGGFRDGQHRGCALRFSGSERVAVVVRDELVEVRSDDWTYRGGG